jgi:hypothetical protein
MKKFLTKILPRIVFYKIFIILVLLATAFIWAISSPKAVSFLTKQIEESLNGQLSGELKVFLGESVLEWKGVDDGFMLKLTDNYLQKGNNVIASVPEMEFNVAIFNILRGKFSFDDLYINSPKLVLDVDLLQLGENANLIEKADVSTIYNNFFVYLIEYYRKNEKKFPIRSIELDNLTMDIGRGDKFFRMDVARGNIKFFNLQNMSAIRSEITTRFEGRDIEVTTEGSIITGDKIKLNTKFNNIPNKLITKFITDKDWIENLKSFSSGDISVISSAKGEVISAHLNLNVAFENNELKKTTLKTETELQFAHDETGNISATGKVNLENLPLNSAKFLWPESIAKNDRDEAAKNFKDGFFKFAEGNFKLTLSKDLKVIDRNFDIKAEVVDASMRVISGYPELTKVKAKLNFNGDNLYANIDEAYLGSALIKNSEATVENLNDRSKASFEVKGKYNGDITELRPLLAAIFEGEDKEYFYNTRDIISQANIDFYYKDKIYQTEFGSNPDLDIKADINGLTIKKSFGNIDYITDNMKMKVDENKLTISSEGKINNSPANIEFLYDFKIGSKIDYELNLKSNISTEDLITLTEMPELMQYHKGNSDLVMNVKGKGDEEVFTGKLNSQISEVLIPEINYKKPENSLMSVSFFGKRISGKMIDIVGFQVVGQDVTAEGSAFINLKDTSNYKLYLSNLNLKDNDLKIFVERSASKSATDVQKEGYDYKVDITGKNFNAENIIKNISSKSSSKIWSADLKINLDQIKLANDVTASNLHSTVKCYVEYCDNINITANFDDKEFVKLTYIPEKETNVRNFKLLGNNAGKFLKGFDISANIVGGILEVNSITKDNVSSGKAIMKDFDLLQAPALTKLFNLASFSGILELLNNKGISFRKLDSDFRLENKFLIVDNLTAVGNSLGITTQGRINLKDSTIDLSGAMTPSYSVNSLLGEIPGIGKIFVAKEGEGVLATRYNVNGSYQDPKVEVNAFSLLTPGALRNIWKESNTKSN